MYRFLFKSRNIFCSKIQASSSGSLRPSLKRFSVFSVTRSSPADGVKGKSSPDHHDEHGHDDGHGHSWTWNEPSGWLFGYRPGYRRQWYWWEPVWYTFMVGGLVLFCVLWNYKAQKTPLELAKEEAHRRLASRGETFGYPLPPDYSPYRKRLTSSSD